MKERTSGISVEKKGIPVMIYMMLMRYFNRDGLFKGIIHHLVHYPDGKVHSPFQIQENVYVEKPIWNNGEFNFLAVDFQEKIIRITKYIPENEKLEIVTELSLAEVEDCYNLMLETTPLTLGRSGNDGFYEIVWPEKKKIAIGKTETVLFVMKISYIYQNGMKIQNIMKM
ncbi:MAG: hypothetical protein LRY71_19310 [Bacillaceae bacterium]|nr:hypothetical protein [Bacillaceae bacterium]